MITAGIDAGIEYTKAVVMKDGRVIGKAQGRTGFADREANIAEVYGRALGQAGANAGDIEKTTATGKGKFQAPFAGKRMSEQIAAARAARHFCHGATGVVSLGADETMAATLGEGRVIDEFAFNQKCSAGLGLFIEYTADRLGLTLDEVGRLDIAGGCASINEGCAVFAELGALELLNKGVDAVAVASAVVYAAAARISSVINDITKPCWGTAVLVGGPAANNALVGALRDMTGIGFVVPESAAFAGAIGAALPE